MQLIVCTNKQELRALMVKSDVSYYYPIFVLVYFLINVILFISNLIYVGNIKIDNFESDNPPPKHN